MFKTQVKSVQRRQRARQGEALRPFHRPPQQLEESLCRAAGRARKSTSPKGRPSNARQSQTDLARPAPARQGRQSPDLHKGKPLASLVESEIEERGPQQPRPHHDAPPGRRPQAALPHRRLQAQQGRHRGEGRAHRIRSEPQRASRAAVLRRRRAPLRHRAERRDRGHAAHVRARTRRSRPATRCRCATSRSARRSTASR